MGTVGSNPTLKDTHKRACKRIVSYFPFLSFQSISKIIRKKKLVQILDKEAMRKTTKDKFFVFFLFF